MARMSIRIDLDPSGRLGPGKVEVLEKIAECGSIAAAGRAMDMSYRRAWRLVADLNACFGEPLVTAQMGGRDGGGASLTSFGRDLVARYRAIERDAAAAVALHLRVLQDAAGGRTASKPDKEQA